MTRKTRWMVTLLMILMVFVATMPNALAAGTLLKEGSTGTDVQNMQTLLKQWGYYNGTVDGKFGPITKNAVKYFQSLNNLSVDGIVGYSTASAIGITLQGNGTTSGKLGQGYKQSDLDLLAKVVYAEARGESYEGQVAVAAVVLNRVSNAEFPNTISGVVYQRNAFTCVNDGQINLTPDSEAYQAAREALNGKDPTNNALYYYNPETATSAWIFSRKVVKVIGHHRFAL